MIVCKGKVNPFPMVETICNSCSLPSGSLEWVDLIRTNHLKKSGGRNLRSILSEIESDAEDKSMVAHEPSKDPFFANSRFLNC
jgi:hypothetical protein